MADRDNRTTKERLSDLEHFVSNHIMSKLKWHDKLIYAVIAMLCLIFAAVIVEGIIGRSSIP